MNKNSQKKSSEELSFYEDILKKLSDAKESPRAKATKDSLPTASPEPIIVEHYLDENGNWIPE